MTSPSELLQAAADRIRDLAAQAVQGPWEAQADGPIVSVVGARGEAVTTDAEWSAAWIAALSPAVAPALEAWLRSTAKAVFVWEELDRPFTAAEEDAVRFAAALCPELVEEDQK